MTRNPRWLVLPLVSGALIAVALGLAARAAAIDPGTYPGGYFDLFFSDPVHLKSWLATAAAALGCLQLVTAAWIFRKLPWRKPAWVNRAHRWSGRLAFASTLPVAYHCIFKLGFRDPDARVLAHSLLGCAVYGAFASKITIVRLHRFPQHVLPVAGGLLFAVLIGVWYTSALWLYREDAKAAPPPAVAVAPAPADADVAVGRRVFGQAGCGSCHTLKAAGASGVIGPNLDALRPTFAAVRAQVENGGGGMPAFRDSLSSAQIRDVSAFVASRAGGGSTP